MKHSNISEGYSFVNKMKINLDVFCSLMVDRI
jgi:hypothetical protein